MVHIVSIFYGNNVPQVVKKVLRNTDGDEKIIN
jgi:hypothetical protein